MKLKIFLLLFFVRTTVFAGACPVELTHSVDRVGTLYAWAFPQADFYSRGSCPTNVWRFLRLLRECQVELGTAQVLFMTEEKLDLFLERGRGFAETWYFHVVLEHEGRIYDFDYGNGAEVPEASVYFETQFAKRKANHWSGILLRVIPAEDYVSRYNEDRFAPYGFYYWLFPERSQFPELTVPALLR